MKSRFITVLAAGLISASPAFAGIVTIDFETPTSFASIDQHYNGGTDSAGVAGPNLGASFGLDALAFRNDPALPPSFSNAPSPIGVMSPLLPPAGPSEATMNYFTGFGFNGLVSFFYSSPVDASVDVWSGFDGTGTRLGTFSLAGNQDGCPITAYCQWDLATIDLGNNVARSITFGDAAASLAAFDDVTVITVPAPGSLALLTFGLAGMGASKRRAGRLATRRQATL